jgi:hypothetical protein
MLVSISEAVCLKKEGKLESDSQERWPRTSRTGENSDCIDALIRENRRTVRELSGILNISDSSVKTAARNKRKRAQTSVSYLQDNAHPHVASRTMDTIQKLKWNVVPHPPYSPDFASSDYHLFGLLERHLGGKGFRNNEEVTQDVQEWLHWQTKDFFLSDIHKLPDRWRKCIANRGDCVENQQFQFRRINQCFCCIHKLYFIFAQHSYLLASMKCLLLRTAGILHNCNPLFKVCIEF